MIHVSVVHAGVLLHMNVLNTIGLGLDFNILGFICSSLFGENVWFSNNHIGGVMVSMLRSRAVGLRCEPRSDQIKTI